MPGEIDMKQIAIIAPLVLFAGLAAPPGPNAAPEGIRKIDLRWTVEATAIPEGTTEAKLWISLPQNLPEQEVSNIRVESEHSWEFANDPDFGNRVVVVTAPSPDGSVEARLAAWVIRRPVVGPRPAKLDDAEKRLYLREEALVTLSARVREIAKKIGADPRARYDYVLASMDYDKTVPGWGAGDTERACDVGKGNCTDFHSLFMSLSRAADTPAVFEMGYSIDPEGEEARTGGYHCWAWFHDGEAWIPVDISEADKAPEKTDFFYGHLDADRITFSRGRDVRLPGMAGPPLNYLPSSGYLEADGKAAGEVKRTMSYGVR